MPDSILSTGSPLSHESFDFVYEHIKRDICLSSIAGGTDIVGCFVGGNPIGPVWRGEIQARCLGVAVEVFDETGKAVRGEKGELVCTRPFPSMPIGFWNDLDGARVERGVRRMQRRQCAAVPLHQHHPRRAARGRLEAEHAAAGIQVEAGGPIEPLAEPVE